MFEKFPKPKTEEELKKQLNKVDAELGAEIAPKEVFDKKYSVAEIKERYPERFRIYLEILRAQKNGQEIKKSDVLEMRNWAQALNNLDSYIASHKKNSSERVLRERQFDVFTDTKQFLETGEKEGYIKLPTGVGKTVLFSQIVESMGLKTLIVVPSKILVNQTGEKLEEFTDLEFGKYYQDEKDFSKPVVTITYASLTKGVDAGIINPDDFGLLILDEVHKALGKKATKTIQKFNSIKLGFTATPKYSEKKHVNNLLEHEIHSMSITEGVQEGLINRFKALLAYTSTDISQVSINNKGDYDEEQIERVVNNMARNLSAVELYQQAFKDESAIVYCSGVDHAEDVAKLFNEHGVRAICIHGKTSKDEREKMLGAFNNGGIKVLCNANLLIEGFDEPRASVCLNLHPTLSIINAEQRGGRVLRLDPINPDKWAYIIDFIDGNAQKDPVLFAEIAGSSEVTTDYAIEIPLCDEKKEKIVKSKEKSFISESGLISDGEDISESRYEKFIGIEINNLKVVVDTKEVLRVVAEQMQKREASEIKELPEGWMTANQFSQFSTHPATVYKFVEQYRETHPEWFKIFRSGTTKAEAFHPDLIVFIRKKLLIEKMPEGWVTAKKLEKQVGSKSSTIRKFAEQYRKTNPEWFGIFRTGPSTVEGYHPDLAAIIKEKLLTENLPDAWMTIGELKKQINVTPSTIKKFVEQYRKTNPEWFGMFKIKTQIAEGLHPDLIAIIKEKLLIEKMPGGWVTARKLEKQVGSNSSIIKKFVEQYRKTNPEWFGIFRTGPSTAEGYHPDLVAIIKEKFEKK